VIMNKGNSDYPVVTASDIGKAEYCPYSLYLSRNNVRHSSSSKLRMKKGVSSHRMWDTTRNKANRRPIPNHIKTFILLVALVLLFLLSR